MTMEATTPVTIAAPLIAAVVVVDGPPPALCSAIETRVNERQPTSPDLC